MTNVKAVPNEFGRRAFLAGATAVSATALIGHASQLHQQQHRALGNGQTSRIGISDAAYQRAWKRAAAMVEKMTLAEKISQTGNIAPAIKRIGLPAYNYYSGEALHGLVRGGPVTSFPLPLAMTCSWNPALALKVYSAVSDEARAYYKKEHIGLSYYSPQTLNLHRDPRWGRCEEAPGEDPCLAGTWAVAVVRGMQGDSSDYLKTTACAKHLICNNTDSDRLHISATVDPRSFWEYYTRAYHTCIMDADVFTFMSAFNAINGIPCVTDRFLLTSLLRDRWRFRGYVTSDCPGLYWAYHGLHYLPTLHQLSAAAIQAGCDVDCGDDILPQHLKRAVADELVSEANISRAITRLLTVRVLLGEFDAPESVPYNNISFDVVDSSAHRALALEAARQSIVLLKNDNNFLPLQKSKLKTVAVIGPTAGRCHLGGYSGDPFVLISPYDGIATALGAPSYHVTSQDIQTGSVGLQVQASNGGGTNLDYLDDGAWVGYKQQDFTGKTQIAIRVSSPDHAAVIDVHIDSLEGPQIAKVAVPHTSSWQNWSTVSAAINGITGKHRVFFRFTGRKGVPLCSVKWFQLQPVVLEPGKPVVIYKPGCTIQGPKDEKMFAEAVDAARNADVVIMVCGVDQSVDAENRDRKDIMLTGVQHELIQACFKANARTMLVISSNNTVAVNWEQDNLPAIVSAIFAGQAQGTAIAEVLFGDYNPGGKTCCTWYKSIDQLPPFHDYDIMKGRTYMYFEGQPLYPFGYGLSYTTFQFSDLHIDSKELSQRKPVNISCTVTNTGSRTGTEIVQVYVSVPQSPVKRPIKELVGFQRLELNPGESRRVSFAMPYTAQALWYWHEQQRKFVLQPGTLKILIGSSSTDIRLNGAVTLLPCADQRLGSSETLTTAALPSAVL